MRSFPCRSGHAIKSSKRTRSSWSSASCSIPPPSAGPRGHQPKFWADAVARPYLDRLPGSPSFLLIGDVRKLLPQRSAGPAASRGSESGEPEHERAGEPCRTRRRRNRSHDPVHEHVGANETPRHSGGVSRRLAEQPVIRLGRRLSAYAGFHERRATRNNRPPSGKPRRTEPASRARRSVSRERASSAHLRRFFTRAFCGRQKFPVALMARNRCISANGSRGRLCRSRFPGQDLSPAPGPGVREHFFHVMVARVWWQSSSSTPNGYAS